MVMQQDNIFEQAKEPEKKETDKGIPLLSKEGVKTVAGRTKKGAKKVGRKTERKLLLPAQKATKQTGRVLRKAGIPKPSKPKRGTLKPIKQAKRRGRKQTKGIRQKLRSRLSQEPSLRKLDIEGSFPLVEPEMDADLSLLNPFNVRGR